MLSWMIKEKLCLNDNKTEFIITETRQPLTKVNIASLCVDDANISPVQERSPGDINKKSRVLVR